MIAAVLNMMEVNDMYNLTAALCNLTHFHSVESDDGKTNLLCNLTHFQFVQSDNGKTNLLCNLTHFHSVQLDDGKAYLSCNLTVALCNLTYFHSVQSDDEKAYLSCNLMLCQTAKHLQSYTASVQSDAYKKYKISNTHKIKYAMKGHIILRDNSFKSTQVSFHGMIKNGVRG